MRRKEVKVTDLRFDPKNPRLPLNKRELSIEETIGYFIRKENIFELISSIGEQGFVEIEPMLAVEQADGTYIVVEGNRRLAALLLLNNPKLAPIKFNTINEIVSNARNRPPEKIEVLVCNDRKEVLDYLGYRHITGVDEWDSLAKARYLHELYSWHKERDGISGLDLFQQLARTIGSRSDYVQKLIRGFFLYNHIREEEGYYEIPNLDDDTFSFSLLTTAISYSNIANFLELRDDNGSWSFNSKHLQMLTEWMFKETNEGSTRVPESRELKTLNAVVANSKALSVFVDQHKPLEEARRYTDEPLVFFNKAIDECHNLLDGADDQFYLISIMSPTTVESVKNLSIKATDLLNKVKGRLTEE